MAFHCTKNGHKHNQVAVVAIPLPAQGHLNPLLQLSHLIAATYDIPVHYVGFASHNRQAMLRAHGLDQKNTTITMINVHDPEFIPLPSLPTKPHNSSKFPVHLQRISEVCHLLRHPISLHLRALSTKFRRIIVIHDSLMASVIQDVNTTITNIETYTFHTSSAFTIFFTIWQSMVEKPFNLSSDIPQHVPSSKGCYLPEFEKFLADQYKLLHLSSGRLYNTCRSLENTYMDLLTKLPVNENKKLFAIGPINSMIKTSLNTTKKHGCLNWLDHQENDSVIYVSFGTTTSMSDEQIRELAVGLKRSEQKFIWVLREADEVDIFKENGAAGKHHDQLLKGYEEAVEGRGVVVRDWASQLEILGHPATGGFMSHCGWNSCLESLSMGVPIAAWPMHSDQPKNSVLVTEVLKVGVVVKDWARREDVTTASVVENAVRRLMASEEGEVMRKRAREMGASVGSSAVNGGASCLELDSFVAHITRL